MLVLGSLVKLGGLPKIDLHDVMRNFSGPTYPKHWTRFGV